MNPPDVTTNLPDIAGSVVFAALRGVLRNPDISAWVKTPRKCRHILENGRRCKNRCGQKKTAEALDLIRELAQLPQVDYTSSLEGQVARLIKLVHCWQHSGKALDHFEGWWAEKKALAPFDVFCDAPSDLEQKDSNPELSRVTIDDPISHSGERTDQEDDGNYNEDGEELDLPLLRQSGAQEHRSQEDTSNLNNGWDFDPQDFQSSPASPVYSVDRSSARHQKSGSSTVTTPSVSPPRFDALEGITTPQRTRIHHRMIVDDTPTKVISRPLSDRLQALTTTPRHEDDETDDETDDEPKAQDATSSANDATIEEKQEQDETKSTVTQKKDKTWVDEDDIPSTSLGPSCKPKRKASRKPKAKTSAKLKGKPSHKPKTKTSSNPSDILFDPHIGQILLPKPDVWCAKWKLLQKIEAPFTKSDKEPGIVYVRQHKENSSYCKVGWTKRSAEKRLDEEKCTAYKSTDVAYDSPKPYVGAYRVEQLVLEDMKRYKIKFVECCCFKERGEVIHHKEWFHIDCEVLVEKVKEWERFVQSMYTQHMIGELGTMMLDTAFYVMPKLMIHILSIPHLEAGPTRSMVVQGQVAAGDDSARTDDKTLLREKKVDDVEKVQARAVVDKALPEQLENKPVTTTEVIRRSIELTITQSTVVTSEETTVISKDNSRIAMSTHHEQPLEELEEASTPSPPPMPPRILTRKDSNLHPSGAPRRSGSTARPRESSRDAIAQGVGKLKQQLRQIFNRSITNKHEPFRSHGGNWNRGRASTILESQTSSKGTTVKAMMKRRLSNAWPTKPRKDVPAAREQDVPRLGRIARAWTFR